MTTRTIMRSIRKRAWWGLLVIAVIAILFGVGDMAGGISADPAIAMSVTAQTIDEIRADAPTIAALADLGVRVGGATIAVLGLLWVMVLVVGLRSGRRWAWLAMWTMPLWMVLITALYLAIERMPDTDLPPPLISGPLLLVVSVVLLLVARVDSNPSSAVDPTGSRDRPAAPGG